jgi:transposase
MEKEQRSRAKEQVVFLMQEGTSWKEAATGVGIQVSRATAYRWLAAWCAHGTIAFQDGRHGHPAKLRKPVRTTLEAMCRQAPETPSQEVQAALQHQFGISVSIGHLNRVRAQLSIGNHVGRLKKNNNRSVLHRKLNGKRELEDSFLSPPLKKRVYYPH